MLVHRPRLKTQGVAVTTVAMLALGACDDPTARTDLRPEGPPDVLAVMVLNDAVDGLVESATYCKPGDEKRPSLVGLPDFTTQQICPEQLSEQVGPVMDAAPELWYVRIVFDELLDPSVEDLIPELDENNQETGIFTGTLRNTQPVTLQCQDVGGTLVDVDYDGYYSPSGNNVTWPLGPSLVIKPDDPASIPVESMCQVTLKEGIRDKSGTPVPADQRVPFSFHIAPVQVIGITPASGATPNPDVGRVDLTFNVAVQGALIPASAFSFDPAVANIGVSASPFPSTSMSVYGELRDSTEYTFTMADGTMVKDKCGRASALSDVSTEFETAALDLVNIVPFRSTSAVPGRKIRLNFNQVMDLTTLTEGVDYEWVGAEKPELRTTPSPELPFAYDPADPSVLIVNGVFKLGTRYQFKLKAGAKISDCPGRNPLIPVANQQCPAAANQRELTIAEEQLIDITTATAATAITAVSVAAGELDATNQPVARAAVTISATGGQTIRKKDATENVFIRFDFNQDMAGDTLTTSEFTLTKADGTAVTIPATPGYGTTSRTTLDLGELPAGSYKFTLKMGATITDRLINSPTTYTQAADRVITFTVAVGAPPFSCLGAP